jgi:hypothetical protein
LALTFTFSSEPAAELPARMTFTPSQISSPASPALREKLVKIGARIVRHGRCVVFQLAEVAVPRTLFAEILRRIDRLRPKPLLT